MLAWARVKSSVGTANRNKEGTTKMAKIEIDGFTFDTEAIPLHNQVVLLTRAIGHVIRNETASSVVAKLRADTYKAEYGNKELSKEAKAEAQKEIASRVKFDADNATHAQLKRDEQAAAAQEILTGELGVRSTGPRLSPLEQRMNTIARDDLIALLVGKGVPFKMHGERPVIPKADQVFKFPSGPRVWSDMVAGYLAKNSDAIHGKAKKQLDAEAKEHARKVQAAESIANVEDVF